MNKLTDEQIAREAADAINAEMTGIDTYPRILAAITAAKQQNDTARLLEALQQQEQADLDKRELEAISDPSSPKRLGAVTRYERSQSLANTMRREALAARGVQPVANIEDACVAYPEVGRMCEHGKQGCIVAHESPAAKQESAPAAEPVLRQLARYIVNHARPDYVDHACERCTGDKDERMPNFVCAVHLSQDILATPSPAQEKPV